MLLLPSCLREVGHSWAKRLGKAVKIVGTLVLGMETRGCQNSGHCSGGRQHYAREPRFLTKHQRPWGNVVLLFQAEAENGKQGHNE